MFHPQIWPAVLGALIGFPVLALAAVTLARRWRGLRSWRWTLLTLLAIFASAYALNVYAWLIEPNRLVVRRVVIASAEWRGAPLRIAAIGDTHVAGPHTSPRRIERNLSRVNGLQPDLILLLGDYVAGHASKGERSLREQETIARGLSLFAALKAPLGVVAVIGNHDVWYDRQAVTRSLEAAGVIPLWNDHLVIRRDGGAFVLAGLADATTGEPDIVRARSGAPETDTIVLSHSPDPFIEVPPDVALTLAAHTHCGQVLVPFLGRAVIPSRHGRRFACGLIEEAGRRMFVTAGVGTSILPVRLLTPPEIVLIEVRGLPPTG